MEFTEAFIAFTALGGPLLLLAFWLWLHARHRRDLLRLAETCIAKGQALDVELMESLKTSARPDPERDMRRGVIYLGLAFAVAVFSLAVQERILLGLASFPCVLGIAYLIFSRRSAPADAGDPTEA
jgi:hypothetical protein